jgi:hypothetical protein
MNRWYREHPEGVKPADAAPAVPAAEQTPEQKALAEAQPADAPKPPAAPEVAPTPQALADMMEKKPAFKEFMDANPDIKGPVFKMARELAEVAPIREIFPSVDDAKFAQEYSSAMVGLKTASMRLAQTPDSAPQFLEMFDSQFAQVKPDGTPVLDAAGKPVYDPDREAVRGAIFNSEISQHTSRITSEIDGLKAKLAGAYPSDFARAKDQERLDNLEYAQTALGVLDQIRDGSFFQSAPPEPPADATPEQKQWFENQKAELARQRQEIEDQKRGASKEQQTQSAQQFQTAVRNDRGAAAATVIGSAMKAVVDSGVYIPEFYMQEMAMNDDGTPSKTAAIVARIFKTFEAKLHTPGSRTLLDIAGHELLPQNDQTKEIRKGWYARKAAELIPEIVQQEVDRIQGLVKLDETRQAERMKERNRVAQPEPQTGGGSLPQNASEAQIRTAAEEAAKQFAAKEGVNWDSLPGNEKQARMITQVHRMQKK